MINIFQKIRLNLLKNGKFKSYLTYAFGEILLVVVGILIALQINNLNQQRLQQNELQEYLQKIAENMSEDILLVEEIKTKRDTLYEHCKEASKLMINDRFPKLEMAKAHRFIYEFYFNANKSGYDALKSSGYLGKLKNQKIDSLLHRYYYMVDRIRDMETSYNNFVEKMEVELNILFPASRIIALRFGYRMKELSEDKMKELEDHQEELINFYKSKPFQAGVIRSASEGTSRYKQLIDIGNEFIEEVNKCSKEKLMSFN